ncbi:ribonuclease M5 [Streptococcus sp. 10F2]
MKPVIGPVVVVEGRDDTANLKRFFQVDTYETRGSALSQEDIERIARLQAQRGVIVFTDPDYHGERIRKMISQAVPAVGQAFLKRGEAVPKSKTAGRSLGVEHADFEALKEALDGAFTGRSPEQQDLISQADLMSLGLLAGSDSRKRREYVGEVLRIGYSNGKQLPKRLAMFGISLEMLEKALEGFAEEEV